MQSEVNQEENLNRIITVPNLLSFFRLCLIPVIIWSYCVKKNPLLAGEILLLSGLTDLADGYIARRFHRISNLGKILDPVADKLTQAAMLICLFTRFPHMLLLIVIMAGKELYMVVSGCLVIRKTGKVHGADWHGKIVTFLLYGTAAVHIIWFHITPMVSDLLIGLCAIMMVISVALYIIQNLMQIFSNLLSNAIKYTQEGGIIQFIAEESETNSSTYGKYHFIVSDNGMGMSADFKETIFGAFTRAESSVTNKIQGTGLGMAITKNLVESMGGTIEVESEPNRGSSFEVILNLKIVENRVVSSTEQIEMHETDSDILDGMRILCAEDNELNAEILMELLKLEGAECTICENGKRILEAFEQSVPGEYDMILMDVQMPVMNGYEATEAIRRSSHEQAKTIPIIAMTANAFSEDMQHSLAAGMNAHISKSVDMKLLKKTIRNGFDKKRC